MKYIRSFHRMELCFVEVSEGTSRTWPGMGSGYHSIAQGSCGCLIRNLFPCQRLGGAF